MKSLPVYVPTVKEPIKQSPGFEKKLLSDYKLDILGLCGFGCTYCSSNAGYYLRIRREPFADLTEAQLGQRLYPDEDPRLTFLWENVIEELSAQLAKKAYRTEFTPVPDDETNALTLVRYFMQTASRDDECFSDYFATAYKYADEALTSILNEDPAAELRHTHGSRVDEAVH